MKPVNGDIIKFFQAKGCDDIDYVEKVGHVTSWEPGYKNAGRRKFKNSVKCKLLYVICRVMPVPFQK